MSRALLSRSLDLQRLQGDGYEVSLTASAHLVVDHIPYVTSAGTVAHGRLISKIAMAGEVTHNPVADHVVFFDGSVPCDTQGRPLHKLIAGSQQYELEPGLTAQHTFSSKPADGTPYSDYHAKMTAYVMMLMGHAQALDPQATAQTYRVVEQPDTESPFAYPDTASSRAGIAVQAAKLSLPRVAIVGLGGTGSYVLDLVAKTKVGEIHLYDGDDFLSHNAFRSPGAATVEQLNARPKKVVYFATQYSRIKHGIVPHPYNIDETNVDELRDADFVFLTMEGGTIKRLIVMRLDELGIPFVDVGLGLVLSGDSITGIARVTTSTPTQRSHIFDNHRIDFADPAPDDIYNDNIQIADLNALNAALAVIKWKKLFGFYLDLEKEHFAAYTIDGNHLINEDQA